MEITRTTQVSGFARLNDSVASYTDATVFAATLRAQVALDEAKNAHHPDPEPSPEKIDAFRRSFMTKVNALTGSGDAPNLTIPDTLIKRMIQDPTYESELLAFCAGGQNESRQPDHVKLADLLKK